MTAHAHDDWGRLTFGCPACLSRRDDDQRAAELIEMLEDDPDTFDKFDGDFFFDDHFVQFEGDLGPYVNDAASWFWFPASAVRLAAVSAPLYATALLTMEPEEREMFALLVAAEQTATPRRGAA